MKTLIFVLSLMSSVPVLAAAPNGCLSEKQAAQTIVSYFTTQDYQEFFWVMSLMDAKKFPAFTSILVPLEGDAQEDMVRVYRSEAKPLSAQLQAEFLAAMESTLSTKNEFIYIIRLGDWSGENQILVDCIGNVYLDYFYKGPS